MLHKDRHGPLIVSPPTRSTVVRASAWGAGGRGRKMKGCREQPPRGAPWVSGLVGHFVQTWPDSECSHTVQCLDCKDLN